MNEHENWMNQTYWMINEVIWWNELGKQEMTAAGATDLREWNKLEWKDWAQAIKTGTMMAGWLQFWNQSINLQSN